MFFLYVNLSTESSDHTEHIWIQNFSNRMPPTGASMATLEEQKRIHCHTRYSVFSIHWPFSYCLSFLCASNGEESQVDVRCRDNHLLANYCYEFSPILLGSLMIRQMMLHCTNQKHIKLHSDDVSHLSVRARRPRLEHVHNSHCANSWVVFPQLQLRTLQPHAADAFDRSVCCANRDLVSHVHVRLD